MNDNIDALDPYFFFEIPLDASDEEIQLSFQRKMLTSANPEQVVHIYSKIRNQTARNEWKWNTIHSHLLNPMPKDSTPHVDIDLEALIKELAFLSPWEAGDLENG